MSRLIIPVLYFLLVVITGCGQRNSNHIQANSITSKNKLVGGGCDGCEVMFVGMPQIINSVDTCSDFMGEEQKILIAGKVYKKNGKTPAPDVIVYYYHTDKTGHYSNRNDLAASQTVHGHLRGWVKTDNEGKYSIYTTRPAPYPGNNIPAHIHMIIKEPKLNEYYIDDLVFNDDKLLTAEKRKAFENRGGSGVLEFIIKDSIQFAAHNIILGLNIPNYKD
jgi:protocatechuate 3,4-dioxygenase, beta subunit